MLINSICMKIICHPTISILCPTTFITELAKSNHLQRVTTSEISPGLSLFTGSTVSYKFQILFRYFTRWLTANLWVISLRLWHQWDSLLGSWLTLNDNHLQPLSCLHVMHWWNLEENPPVQTIREWINRSYTVNFQNNAQVQINAWFKLTPGYQAHCLQFTTLFLYFKRTPGSI